MRKYLCALALLLLYLDIPSFAQYPTQPAESDVKLFVNSPKPSLASPNSFERVLIGYEHQFWGAMKSKDVRTINALVADDARFVDENSIVSKSEFTRQVSNYTPSKYSLTGIKVKAITAEVGIVNYKVEAKYIFNSIELPVMSALVTSVWVSEGGKWRLKHHHVGLMPVTKAVP